MTVYEFVTELERRVDYWKFRGRPEHEPVVTFRAPKKFWGNIPVRPKRLGDVIEDRGDGRAVVMRRYQFTMNQARRVADILRGRE
jgi:hypothetical protein